MSTYNWNAEDYEKHSQSQQQWARELIGQLSLKGGEDVLDIGCGDGKVTAEIAGTLRNGTVIGVDNSESMIRLATERYPKSVNANLSFKVMDASHLPFEGCFDVVFSNAALHWVKNHKPLVEGLYKCLKPGGKILLQMGGRGNARHILSVLTEIQSYPEWEPYFEHFEFPYSFLGIEEYDKLLTDSSFEINRVALLPKDMEHTGKPELEGWLRTTWLPYTERVPEGKRDRFIQVISAQYLKKVPMTSDGKAHVAMVRLEIEATKPHHSGIE